MQTGKPIELQGKPLNNGALPAICTPLVGRTPEKILSELDTIVAKKPDIIEWRVDFFEGIGDTEAVLKLSSVIRQKAEGIPLLFTRRSIREGGEKIAMTEEQVVALYEHVCAARMADIVDMEMSSDPSHIQQVREAAAAHGIKLLLSFHNFQYTPGLEALNQRFLDAERMGADIAKVAVMPRDLNDVLTLLTATLQSSQKLRIPLVSMSMGSYGALTRMIGGAFGSAMTFAIGQSSSAPGQIPVDELNTVLGILRRSMSK